MKYLITISTALLSLAFRAGAQTQGLPHAQSAEGWTLEECVLYAVEHSPLTNIQEAQNQITGQNYREAIGALLPSLDARVGADFNFGRSLGEDNVYADANSFNNSYGASTGLTLFAGLRNINNIRMQRVNRITGRHALDQTRDEVAYATMEAFFKVLYYQKMVVLAASQLEESRFNLHKTEREEELGLKGFPDVAEMRAQEASNSYMLTTQQNLLTIGIILLKEQMNFPIDTDLDIAPYDIEVAVDKTPLTAETLYMQALDYLPRALAVESSVRASEIGLQIARGQRLPTISASAGWSTGFFRNLGGDYTSFSDQFRGKRNYGVGLTLSVPIFRGFSTSASIKRSKFNLDIARIEHDEALRALYTDIEQSVADMNGMADQHVQAVRSREYTSVAHDVNQRKYDEGLVSALELHTSSNRLMQARAEELNTRLTYILKKRMVDYYSGLPLIPHETETLSEN
jgi:outer membrane protein